MRAPLRVHAFVAYAPDKLELPLAAGQQARFDAVIAFFEREKRWPNPPQIKLLAQQAEEAWLGPPLPPLELPSAPAVKPSTPQDPTAPPRRATSADYALSLASAVMEQDPEMAELLTALAARRRQAESANT